MSTPVELGGYCATKQGFGNRVMSELKVGISELPEETTVVKTKVY
jgi:hypothetical protein|tara:strand:+ start:1043 stop:1177 length:135 start_codon:yes stop_codon:yes gene_type:complete